MKLKLNSIKKEAAACRKAFGKFPIGGFTLHCHHEQSGETLNDLVEKRITYILSFKQEHEQALRLRLFRPISNTKLKHFKQADDARKQAQVALRQVYSIWMQAQAAKKKADPDWKQTNIDFLHVFNAWNQAAVVLQQADADLGELVHKKFCIKDCPWNGKTIFPVQQEKI